MEPIVEIRTPLQMLKALSSPSTATCQKLLTVEKN